MNNKPEQVTYHKEVVMVNGKLVAVAAKGWHKLGKK